MKVLAFGEILWDIIDGNAHLGGAPFNFAAHSARCGNESFIISRLGKDELGEKAFQQCSNYGVNTSFIQWDDQFPTGVVDVKLNNGQPDYVIRKHAAYDFIEGNTLIENLKEKSFDVFYFGSLAQRNTVSAKTLQTLLSGLSFTYVFYDVNLRKECYNEQIIRYSLSVCNIFKLNHEEVPVLSNLLFNTSLDKEGLCRKLVATFPNLKIVIITAADEGCYVFVNEKLIHVSGQPVRVVDAVGAGDSFSAAFMHSYFKTHNSVFAASIANRVGGFVASQAGAIPAYSEEVRTILFE